jgi:putative intracellular protease/amidase
MTKAVLVATSCHMLPASNRRTGVALAQFGAVRDTLLRHGWDVMLASPQGGAVPVDAGSCSTEWASAADYLSDSVALRDLDSTDADTWIILGGHGAVVDLPENPTLTRLLGLAAATGQLIIGLDHGAAALAEIRTPDDVPVVTGLRVTGRSDAEERDVQHHWAARPSTEQRLRAAGARYSQASAWEPYVVAEGALMTAQNPASVAPALWMLLATTCQLLDVV